MGRKVASLEGSAAGRDIIHEKNAAPEINVEHISGGTNIIGNQGGVSVQINSPRAARPKIVVQPGLEHIDGEQKVALAELRNEWLALHTLIKKTPLSPSIAWARINKAAGATSYHLILKSRYGDALAFVKREMAKLRMMKSAPSKDVDWRAKRIAAIKARCKNQLGNIDAYKPYIMKNFKVESLSALSTDELQRTYAYIMAKKKI